MYYRLAKVDDQYKIIEDEKPKGVPTVVMVDPINGDIHVVYMPEDIAFVIDLSRRVVLIGTFNPEAEERFAGFKAMYFSTLGVPGNYTFKPLKGQSVMVVANSRGVLITANLITDPNNASEALNVAMAGMRKIKEQIETYSIPSINEQVITNVTVMESEEGVKYVANVPGKGA